MRLIRISLLAAAVLAGSLAVAADDRSSVGDPALRLSTSLARVPVEPVEAASSTTAGFSFTERTRQPVDVLRQASEQSERDLLAALTAAKQHQEATAEIERRLAQARAQRYANPVVYTLAALLAMATIGALVFWSRMRPVDRDESHRAVEGGQPSG